METELPSRIGPTHSAEELHCDDHRDNLRSKLIASSSRHVTLRVAIKHASSWLHYSRIPTSKWRTDCPLMRCAERIIVSLTSVPQKGGGKLTLSREGRCKIKVYSSTGQLEGSRQYMIIFCVSISFFIVSASFCIRVISVQFVLSFFQRFLGLLA
jgi:hypothetical protein